MNEKEKQAKEYFQQGNDYWVLFKILILQRYYNLSDEQIEYQINDRLSFMRFLDLTLAGDVPDSRTVWHFREQITDLGLVEKLFDLFLEELNTLGLVINEGKIIDASFVEVPRQRNWKAENERIKEGKGEELWNEKPRKKSQKDVDARWTQKNKTNYYGYKNHVKEDGKSKLIVKYLITSAEVHDSQTTDILLDENDRGEPFYADSACTGEPQEQIIASKEMENRVCEKGYRNRPLTEEQKANNTEKSRFRSRVEHIFGFMEMSMNEMYIQCIGIKRATATTKMAVCKTNASGEIVFLRIWQRLAKVRRAFLCNGSTRLKYFSKFFYFFGGKFG